MTREEAFKEINDTQEEYVDELIKLINNKSYNFLKTLNFTSPTGTGKTNMMSLLCNKLSDYYFIITTLSRGQLNRQIKTNMEKLVSQDNFMVYGLCDYTSNTKLTATEIISRLPIDKKIIWLRDEGHINTNKWQEVLSDRCFKVINFSATNKDVIGINCNFTNTMMLRTVIQNVGTPEDALDKLLEVKKQHIKVKNYNPCAIMRCLDDEIEQRVINACIERNLNYINITTEDFDMSDLCQDDNEYDVILNKFKIVEGIDIRRAHVLYMTNEPKNPATTIQVIGRCRRNALLYRDDIDILDIKNKKLLENTRQCFVYYNVTDMSIDTDKTGELIQAFCDIVSCQELKPNSIIEIHNGKLSNGLKVMELDGCSGKFEILIDHATGFNIVKPESIFYNTETEQCITETVDKFYGYTKEELFDENKFARRQVFNYAIGSYTDDWEITLTAKQSKRKKYYKINIGKLLDVTKLYNGKQYRFEKRLTNSKKIAVDVYRKIAMLDLASYDISHVDSKIIELDYVEDKVETKYFCSDESATKFISEYNNKNCATKLKLYNSYVYEPMSVCKKFYFVAFEKDPLNANDYTIINLDKDKDIQDLTWYQFSCWIEKKQSGNINTFTLSKTIIEKYFENMKYNQKNYIDYYEAYTKITNDRESAIVGVDLMKMTRDDGAKKVRWIEDKAVTGKVSKYCKLNAFITNHYAKELDIAKPQLFTGKNNFKFNTKCNSCLGYLVEYYSKYLVYGEGYLGGYIKTAMRESKVDYVNDYIIIRACMLKYKAMMVNTYGCYMQKIVKTISVEQLIKDDYKEFVETVIKLGARTAEFVKPLMLVDDKKYDPNLSIKHIAGLADYINKDTIIDIKTTNNITIDYIKQVLAYHYLSTKRSDLQIKRVIVYDAVSGKSVTVNINQDK